jgi:predicted alpha/beta hydrolase
MENITIQTEDGRLLAGTWIRASGALPVRGTVVVHSATGVPCKFYNAFATYLSKHALDVFLWDARGIGKSATVHARDDSATMRDWGQRDQQAVLHHLRSADPSRKLVIIGHSSGGHLSGLAPLTSKADALILIASGGCDWRDYPRSQWPRLLAAWWLAMPLLLKFWGYLPAWAGVGHDLPRGVAQDWRLWSLTRGYLFGDATIDTAGYSSYGGPLLALSISDDQGFAPPRAVRALLQKFVNAKTHHHEIPAAEGDRGRIGHFGFFKSQNVALWPYVRQWLDIVLSTSETSDQNKEDGITANL